LRQTGIPFGLGSKISSSPRTVAVPTVASSGWLKKTNCTPPSAMNWPGAKSDSHVPVRASGIDSVRTVGVALADGAGLTFAFGVGVGVAVLIGTGLAGETLGWLVGTSDKPGAAGLGEIPAGAPPHAPASGIAPTHNKTTNSGVRVSARRRIPDPFGVRPAIAETVPPVRHACVISTGLDSPRSSPFFDTIRDSSTQCARARITATA
jgi:hypothetical protein